MLSLLIILSLIAPTTIFEFNEESDIKKWRVVDDVVMGGESSGKFTMNNKHQAVYSGEVSLENNGGFSSLRYTFDQMSIKGHKTAKIRLKGDKKKYQFRVKTSKKDRHSYKYVFKTSGKWETIEIPLNEMEPTWRGFKPDLPNYEAEYCSEIGFLISNKKEESFELLLESIVFE
jgi:NADH dehydrogenase [ubiquinone] 1 alpha subcomplex assembly factor 1